MHAKKDSKHKESNVVGEAIFHDTLNRKYINMKYEYYSIGGVFPILNKLLNW